MYITQYDKWKISLSFLILLIAIVTMGWGQFVEVNVDIDMRRLRDGDRQLFNTFAEDIKQYYQNTQFSPDVADLEIIIDIRLIIESVSQGGSQTTVNAQAIFTNKRDQYFYAKGIQFPYSSGQKIIYTPTFYPLSSFLDYYAFMFIATELDTWDYMGGTSYYNRAVELSDIGKDSDWSQGWNDRWKKSRKIKNNQYLRSMRFNFFMALDALAAEKVDINLVKTSMNIFYEDLKEIDKKLGINKETLKFLEAYHINIAELLAALKLWKALELLKHYDYDHNKVYESYLKN